ncbi:DUF29 domain-containing protein [filamentous cyanobacterium CCP1]|nr:DUF29 domain-containing protein [filamentous cyanobacterium CCP2]PSB66153.1 DUF29 domain-containing protein [filamentous cyanobacterium CCP1]
MTSSLPAVNHLSTLYQQDYYQWLQVTAHLLREKQFSALDTANLLEEIEEMGRSEKRAMYSNLKILLLYLFKDEYQPEMRSNSWKSSIVEHRQRLQHALKESPSLQPYLPEIFNDCYQDARELAAAETGLAIEQFPSVSPFSVETTLKAGTSEF